VGNETILPGIDNGQDDVPTLEEGGLANKSQKKGEN
jgi:hypothetical protein